MNYSTSIIPPAKPAKQEHTPEFGASSKSKECSTPFGSVLDRAVKSPTKLKGDALTAGRGEDRRQDRLTASLPSSASPKSRAESKSSDPTCDKDSKIEEEEKKKDTEVATPVVCIGMPTPVIPPPVEITIAPVAASVVESSVSEVSDSTTRDSTAADNKPATVRAGTTDISSTMPELASSTSTPKPMTEPTRAAESSKTKAAVSELAPVLPEPVVEKLQAVERPVENVEPKMDAALKNLLTPVSEVLTPKSQSLDTQSPLINAARPTIAEVRPVIPVSNVREAVRGVSAEVKPTDSVAEIPQPVAEAQAVVANDATPIETRRAVRPARRAVEEVAANTRGTAVAKVDMTMNKALKTEEVAGLSGQILPSSPSVKVSAMNNLPSESPRSHSSEIVSLDALNVAARAAGGPTRSDSFEVKEVRNADGASTAARLGEVISREVRMFKRGADDLMEVVLTPDAKTQISLKLQWREGQVEVQARCDMGNHQSLNAHWPELQTALAANGVRLSHLAERVHTGFTEFFSNSGFSQQRGNDQQPAPQQRTSDITLPAVMQPVKTTPAKTTIRSNGRLESWA